MAARVSYWWNGRINTVHAPEAVDADVWATLEQNIPEDVFDCLEPSDIVEFALE